MMLVMVDVNNNNNNNNQTLADTMLVPFDFMMGMIISF